MDWKRSLGGRFSLISVENAPWWAYVLGIIAFFFVGVVWAAPEWRKDLKEAIIGAKLPIESPQKAEKTMGEKTLPKVAKAPEMQAEIKQEAPATEKPRITPYPVPSVSQPHVASPDPLPPGTYGYRPPVKGVEWKLLDYGALYNGPITALKALARGNVDVPDEVVLAIKRNIQPPIAKDDSVVAVRVSVADLGFSRPATFSEILGRASEFGLRPFPANAIPAAALAFSNEQKFFFTAQVAPREFPWTAAISVGRRGARVGLAIDEWHGFFERNFDRPRTFHPKAVLLFAKEGN